MRILGIDPGSVHTGYGLVEKRGSRVVGLAFGRLSPPKGRPLPERLGWLVEEFEGVLERFEPETAVLESLFHGRNTRSLIILAEARGALLSVLARHPVKIREYAPAEVKSAVTGNGRAPKEQVAKMVRLLLSLDPEEDVPADAADALAVAVCGAQRLRMDRLGERVAKRKSLKTGQLRRQESP